MRLGLILGLGGGTSVRSPLSISPTTATKAPLGTQTFVAEGGTPPYVYTVSTNNSGGSVGASTGAYVAGSTGSVSDTVRVTDAVGHVDAVVTVSVAVSISPLAPSMAPAGTQTFTAAGGSGGYVYSISTNNSGGTINASSGLYTAGATTGTDTVRATDSNGATASTTAVVVYDPAVLNLAIWVRTPYSASPWVGVASAGASGTRNLTEATNPPTVGANLNGRATASFNGTSSKIGIATFLNSNATNLLGSSGTSSAYGGWALINVTALGTNGTDYNNQCIISTGPAAYFCVYLKSGSGGLVGVANYDGSREVITTAIGTAAWVLVQWKLVSGVLKIRLNGGAWATVAAGALSAPNGFQLGYQPNDSAHYYNGLMGDFALYGFAPSDATDDLVKSYINSYHGTAF